MVTDTPVITLGGVALTLSYAGLAPGEVGVYQINATVPSAFALGWAPTVLTNFQVDSFAPGSSSSTVYLDNLTIFELMVQRATTSAVTGFEDQNRRADCLEVACGCKPGKPCPHDDDINI